MNLTTQITTQSRSNKPVAVVQFLGRDEKCFHHSICEGGSLILGSDEQSGVRLEGTGIAPRHCVIHVADGNLFVTDWFSETGTRVNGEKIYAETCVRPTDLLEVGPYQLRYMMATESTDQDVVFKEHVPVVADIEPSELATLNDTPESRSPEKRLSGNTLLSTVEDPLTKLQKAQAEIARLERELDYQRTLAALNDARDASSDDAEDELSESTLLRAEVEQLQTELMQREEEIRHLVNGSASEPANELPAVNDGESDRLVDRLEQLLAELSESDERVRNLETLLHASDDATLAEREEREQLGHWVSEIETRVADREQQWKAREERLEARLKEAAERCRRAETSAEHVVKLHAGEFQQQLQRQVVELQEDNERLASELDEARTEHSRLREVVSRSGVREEQLQEFTEQQAELKLHEIEIARERALIARQTAEIARLRDELDRAVAPVQNVENPDCRIRQFREHLREIHDLEEEQRKQRSLSGRLSRLWNRITD